jgi:cellulose synthase/poly-beta-1,6-N-acetylglucosamine synthase-like glycosyltransferase
VIGTEVLLWLFVAVVAYTYVLYPILLLVLYLFRTSFESLRTLLLRSGRRLSDRLELSDEHLPTISFVLAARNEVLVIEQKIRNFLEIRYPKEKMELLIGSDASEDGTVAIARRYESVRVRIFDFKKRSGKTGVLKKLVPEARGEILVLSDANTFFRKETVRNLVRHFSDPRVGAVCGELRLEAPDGSLQTEGVYWRYETILKTMEGAFGSVLGANGGIYAIRAHLFPRVPIDTISEDFLIPLLIRKQGYRMPFDREAVAFEKNPVDPAGEFRRRVRIGSGCVQALVHIAPLLSPRFGFLAFALFSHKLMRWSVPIALIGALVTNLLLLNQSGYLLLFVVQIVFYVLAWAGHHRYARGEPLGLLTFPFLFITLNLALLIGYYEYFATERSLGWERTERLTSA